MSQELLNPVLYSVLQRHLGDVEVVNPGVQLIYDYIYDHQRKKETLMVVRSGEEYRACCDVCHDTRRRLHVNHSWWFYDKPRDQTWSHLIHCFNEDCYATYERREMLHTRLYSGSSGRPDQPRSRGPKRGNLTQLDAVPTCSLPGTIQLLGSLGSRHKAVDYLECRYFNVPELSKLYHIGYCENSVYDDAQDRIIIPAYLDQRLVGWQARHIGELDWKADGAPPKYFTCPGMKRGSVVYNIDRAKHYRTVVIVEGPMDAWNVGPMAVSIWGSTVTEQQKIRLARDCGQASAVLLLDPEIMNPTTAAYAKIKMRNLLGLEHVFAGGLALVALPHGTDPGSLDRTWMREYITEQAAEGGVTVEFKRW